MTNQLFAAALGIAAPWSVQTVDFDAGQRWLTIHVDFVPGSRIAHAKAARFTTPRSSGCGTSTSLVAVYLTPPPPTYRVRA